jgi:acetyl-CoA carboxylase beta subunit
MVDMVVARKDLKDTLARLLDYLSPGKQAAA